jgi:ketosteroid isomerase-like protein
MHSRHLAVLLALGLGACGGNVPPGAVSGAAASDTVGVAEAQRGWWRAYAVADTAYLQAHTAPAFSLTVSTGATFDRAAMLAQAATHVNGSRMTMAWSDETARLAAPSVAVATVRSTESDGPAATSTFRYLTVMERAGNGWRVSAAQSTRELAFTPRVPVAQAGDLREYAGAYRTPRGTVLRVEARDSALALIEPSGNELPMLPIGPGLFELGGMSPLNGIVRMVFTRDARGQVTVMTRLVNGAANTFPRIP